MFPTPPFQWGQRPNGTYFELPGLLYSLTSAEGGVQLLEVEKSRHRGGMA